MALGSKRIKLGNGIYLNIIENDKFKSNLLSYYILRPLDREEVTKNALLPLVLKRGSNNFPTSLEIEKQLENMYGANFSAMINKKGEKHILRFTLEWVNSDYIADEDLEYKAVDMLKSVVHNPYLEDDHFKKDYVDKEKENLKNKIESKILDKRSYAINRCIEVMCKYEKFSLYSLGYVEDLEKIDEKNLYDHYLDILDTSQIELFYVGKMNEDLIEYIIKSFEIERENIIRLERETLASTVQNKNSVNEKSDINQGKLVLGYRAGIAYDDPLYNGLLLASDIFGGGPNSKLFRNVREKESLAYYVSSSILKYKSLMIVDAGIEFEDYDKTISIINNQLEELKSGNFSEDDIEISKKSLRTSTSSIMDSAFLISEFFFSQELSKDERSLEEVINDLERTTKEDIVEAAQKINIDTIYFLENL